MRTRFIAGMLWLVLAYPLVAQQAEPLSLQQAVALGLQRSPERKAAVAETKAARADIDEARSSFLPHLNFSEAITRSNDPVYVFGTRLRQSRFTAADFTLNRLNQPTPISNFATRFDAHWSLFDSFASFLSVRRARQMQEAAQEQLALTDQQTVFRVVEAYYALLLATKELEVAEQSIKTAKAVVEDSSARVQAGTVVESDLLSAQVNLASRQQELFKAQNATALARAQLNVTLGLALDHEYQPAEALAERRLEAIPLRVAEERALKARPDLKQISDRVAAQKTGVELAKSAFGPRVNAFAASELDNISFFGNGSNNWLAGVELNIDLFSGGEKRARLLHEKAMLEKASAGKQLAEDRIRIEVRRAFYDWDSAQRVVEVARAAVSQSEESLRITRNRYAAGLTTITELLRSEDSVRTAQTNYWSAIYGYNVSYAALELATGSLNQHSPVITP